jgi:taurine--2-oxoglutarate transaminase
MSIHTEVGVVQQNLEHTLFSWSKQSGLAPIQIARAEGVYLWDEQGRKILDFSSQLMNVNIGHGNQRITDAVSRQMKEVSYIYPGMVTKVRGQLGRKLAEICPGNLNKAFFTLGGSESIENAIKLARIYTGRHKIIAQYRSYHGATYGAVSAGGDPRKFAVDSQGVPNIIHVENPYAYRCPWGTSDAESCGNMAARNLEQVILYENPGSIAAILMEGESGSSGCIKYPPNYWKQVRAIADKYGILLIADEVMSGFGRTGKWFGVDNHGVVPDLMCMAKGITSGYVPLGALMVSDTIAAHFEQNALPLGLTYSAHPVACAAALENIAIMEEEDMPGNARRLGGYLEKRVAELAEIHPSIGDFRNTGLFGCIELVRNRQTKMPLVPWNAAPSESEPSNRIAAKLKELGMFTFVRWNWIFIAPPLCINEAQIDEGLAMISQALNIADEYYTQ